MTTQVNTTDADVNVTGDGDVTISANNDVDVTASQVSVSGDANVVGSSAAVTVSGENATVTVEAENPTINAVNAVVTVLGEGGETIPSYKPSELPTDGSVTKAYVIVEDDTMSVGWKGVLYPLEGGADICMVRKVLAVFDDTIKVQVYDAVAEANIYSHTPRHSLRMIANDEVTEEDVQLPSYWIPAVEGGVTPYSISAHYNKVS